MSRSADGGSNSKYILKLYITGMTPNSIKAVSNIKNVCEEYLKDQYEIQIIDIYQEPGIGEVEQIIATPTLIKEFPLPVRILIGDLSDREKVLLGLDIKIKI